MRNFKTWYDNADMPEKGKDGKWYDLEDGIKYSPDFDYINNCSKKTKQRQNISINTKEARNKAKFFGGKALKGTKKQKEWAEKIRAEKLQCMSETEIEALLSLSVYFGHSKFWIENRGMESRQIISIYNKIKGLILKHNAITAEIYQIFGLITTITDVEKTREIRILEEKQQELKKEMNTLVGISTEK